MSLSAGTRLGPYEIVAPIGAGGMGEVYKARDTRLERIVAIKVLPERLAADPQFRERFDREARAISQLDHPHICALYDVGEQNGTAFLVMQYLDGETLAARLEKGALPVTEALTLGAQIADALDKAHRAGITNRDLKPGNVMLTKSGSKLLDFGLAKTGGPIAGTRESMLPTQPPSLTAHGTILGTFQYMAPEQVEGQQADARTDIFACGTVLYEMLTGRRAFTGKSTAGLLGAILKDQPAPISRVQPGIPSGLDRVVRKCLEKDPEARWQSAHDLRDELAWIATDRTAASAGAEAAPRISRERLGWIAAMVAVMLGSGFWVLGWSSRFGAPGARRTAADAPELRLQLVTPPGASLTGFAISPDGRALVFQAPLDGRNHLWLRSLDSETARQLPGTDNGTEPFWSPDGRAVAFFAGGQLKRIDLASGLVQVLTSAPNGRGGTWGRDGTILFVPAAFGAIYRVSDRAGDPVQVTRLDPPRQSAHRYPHFLPDGRHFVFYVYGELESRGLYLGSLDSPDTHRLVDAHAGGAFLAPGRLLFARQGALLAQQIDLDRFVTMGAPLPVAEDVAVNPAVFGQIALSASAAGPIAYRTAPEKRQLIWLNRSGDRIGVVGEPDASQPADMALSHDGRTLALDRTVDGNTDIWLVDLSRGTPRRFTTSATRETTPVWSPDDSRIIFDSDPKGSPDLYEKAVDGVGTERLLLALPEIKEANDWSPDGRAMIYALLSATNQRDLWVLPLVDPDRKPWPLVQTPFAESGARFSGDGRFVAYHSNENGSVEVYVQPFPGPGRKMQISTKGGAFPRWRSDGRELYYLSRDNRLMAVPISVKGSTVEAGPATALFTVPRNSEFVVAPDGQRFLVNAVVEDASPITILMNWQAGLTK